MNKENAKLSHKGVGLLKSLSSKLNKNWFQVMGPLYGNEITYNAPIQISTVHQQNIKSSKLKNQERREVKSYVDSGSKRGVSLRHPL